MKAHHAYVSWSKTIHKIRIKLNHVTFLYYTVGKSRKKSQSSLMKNPVTRAVPGPLFSPMLNCFYFHCLNQTFHRVKVNSKHHFRCKVLTITIKIAHWSAIISLTMYVKLKHLSTDKNVEVDVTSSLIWALRIHSIIGKASRLLGLLKRTCLLLTDVPVRY